MPFVWYSYYKFYYCWLLLLFYVLITFVVHLCFYLKWMIDASANDVLTLCSLTRRSNLCLFIEDDIDDPGQLLGSMIAILSTLLYDKDIPHTTNTPRGQLRMPANVKVSDQTPRAHAWKKITFVQYGCPTGPDTCSSCWSSGIDKTAVGHNFRHWRIPLCNDLQRGPYRSVETTERESISTMPLWLSVSVRASDPSWVGWK